MHPSLRGGKYYKNDFQQKKICLNTFFHLPQTQFVLQKRVDFDENQATLEALRQVYKPTYTIFFWFIIEK